MWSHGADGRQRSCRHHPHGHLVEVLRREGGRAHFGGLVTCGNVWTCPFCGAKIAVERAEEIQRALIEQHRRGGQVALLTLTMRHSHAQSLAGLLDGINRAWATLRQSRTSRALLDAYSEGWIKRLEVTVGPAGWHPHLHVLLMLGGDVTVEQLQELAAAATKAWEGKLVRLGLGDLDPEHGVSCQLIDMGQADQHLARYVAKSAAFEVSAPGTKITRRAEHRTPLQLLADLERDGLAADFARWREYEQVMHGRQQLRWSHGLRARLLSGEVEASDQELAERTDHQAELVCLLHSGQWAKLREIEDGPALLLHTAASPDPEQALANVTRLLHQLGLGPPLPPPASDP